MTTGIRIGVGILVLLLVNACGRAAQEPAVITLMTFNVENLFDTEDDPGKDDYTYLPLAQKQTDEHKKKCAGIAVDRWRDQCLNWDWIIRKTPEE